MGDSKFDQNHFHPLSFSLLLATMSDSPQSCCMQLSSFEQDFARCTTQSDVYSLIMSSDLNQPQINLCYSCMVTLNWNIRLDRTPLLPVSAWNCLWINPLGTFH